MAIREANELVLKDRGVKEAWATVRTIQSRQLDDLARLGASVREYAKILGDWQAGLDSVVGDKVSLDPARIEKLLEWLEFIMRIIDLFTAEEAIGEAAGGV